MKRTIKPKSSFTRKMAEGGLVMTTNSPTPPPDQQLQEARRERQRRRMTAEMDDLRSKLEREKAEALCQQKEAMNRAFRVQLAKLMKEKEDLIRKCQTKNQLAPSSPTNSAATNTNPELQKLVYELGVVRSEKKKTEDQLQVLKESEQVRFENMRSLLDDKTRELTQLQKQLKQQIARLREEAHTKDRVISHLESELRIQSGRAQQFRDILEQNLLSCCNKTGHHNQQQQNAQDVTSSLVTTSTNRERQLQIQVDDLQLAIKEQQETFAQEKRELLRRISETEQEQKPLKKKSKEYLIRNVLLSTRNHLLVGKVKMMQQQSRDDGDVAHKRSRQNVNHLAAPPKNDKQRRMEYVQQIQKLRKEQRYYSMWELPPLLEVETDSAGESGGSEGSLSPAATSGVCSSSESAWSDETRRELEVLFSQLSREHSDLQRNYQMLHEKLRQLTSFSDTDAANVNYATLQADYTAAKARIRDLEEILQLKNSKPSSATPSLLEIQAKFVREKHSMQTQLAMLNHRLIEAKNKTQAVQAELNETRDQNELLEFRILELEESQEKVTHQCCPVEEMKDHTVNCKDVCTDTDSGDDVSAADSGITSLTSYSLIVDCPSSTSSSTSGGLSPDADYLGEKISAVKTELQLMVPCVSEAKHKTVLAQVQALLGVCQSRLLANKNNSSSSPTVESSQSNWDCWQQLQESGIFEEDHQRSSRNSSSVVDSTTQTDEERRHREMTHQSVQVGIEVKDSSVQSDSRSQEDKTVQVSSTLELAESIEGWSQTEEPIMTLTDFRDIELYYVEQIELLQKEKASHRKKFQVCRDETTQVVQQLELLTRQFHEREKQFDDILQKNCEAFERELESARMEGGGSNEELSALKECLQSIWQEMKNYVDIVHPTGAASAGVEFGQALVSSLNGLCTELGQLRTRVVDLAEMEQAFQTTLQQADGLVHHIEEKHLNRIRELELNEQELKQQLDLASRNRSSVYQSEEEDDDGSLQFKLQELKSENEALTAQAAKVEELQEYCQQLHGRLEEYDQREKSFQLVIQEAERRFSSKEQRYKEEVESLRIELDKCRESELAWPKKLELRENQLSTIKNELETERVAIARLETEVKDLQSKSTKDDTSFRNEVTKLRSQLKASIAQLSELESLNCALRDQIMEHQHRITSLQRSLEMESCRNQDLMAENNQLIQAQNELINRHNPTSTIVMVGKPLTEELFEVETDDAVTVIATGVAHPNNNTSTTLDDFREISLPTTPMVIEGCTDIFEEHFKVLESLESYLESQQLIGAVSEDESGISTSPSIHENEPMAMLEAQLSQLRTEKHFLLNSVVQSQKKDEIIHILIDQLKYNAPRQYLVDTAAQIRRMTAEDSELQHPFHHRDKDIEDVCRLLEEPVDLSESYNAPVSSGLLSMSSSMSSSCHSNNDRSTPTPSAIRQLVRQTTVTVLPEEDPLLSPASDLRVTRKVGQDGLVIAWHPSPDPECTGYLICINGQEAQRVRNATRTKAVLCGLDLHSEMEISIYSLSTKGLVSSPDCALYLPEENVTDSSTTPEPRTTENRVALPSDGITPREVVVQTFYTNSSVTVRSSRRVNGAPNPGSRIPVRASMP